MKELSLDEINAVSGGFLLDPVLIDNEDAVAILSVVSISTMVGVLVLGYFFGIEQ